MGKVPNMVTLCVYRKVTAWERSTQMILILNPTFNFNQIDTWL
jgi:hypothetical protein